MADFFKVVARPTKSGITEIFPKFIIKSPSSDLMIRGRDFYAVWNETTGLWSTSEQDLIDMVDRALDCYVEEHKDILGQNYHILHMWDSDTGVIDKWHKYCQKQMQDSYHMLDEELAFSNSPITKKDYVSKRLSYPLEEGDISAWDKLISTLYSPEERAKIEWTIGAIVCGDSRYIQKFCVFYGAAGTGKSTILNVIQQLFDGYFSTFDAKALGQSSNVFALEAFKKNPLVAIQHDGDLSHIEDNTRLNSLVSHELMTVNEKFKSTYENRFKSFLLMGTNRPVKITDAKSGLIRRLIDITPTGNKLNGSEYKRIMKQIGFELGAIAFHCEKFYQDHKDIYDDYVPIAMLGASNDFYNFMLDSWAVFKRDDQITLKAAWELYKAYCDDAKVPYPYSQRIFKEELKNYFDEYKERTIMPDGTRVRNVYLGFQQDKFQEETDKPETQNPSTDYGWLRFDKDISLFDEAMRDCPAQLATETGTPSRKWANVQKTLKDIPTKELHYVKVPENHIVIDFDRRGPNGEKMLEANMEEASKWPPTYAELSKSGAGIHLHYIYAGDVSKLSCVYDNMIEVKVFTGNSSLRRKLSRCNDIPFATLSHGLPLKEAKKTVNFDAVKSERGLRQLVERNLHKEIHPGTKPSIDFIVKILDDAYAGDLNYDISDMRGAITVFATKSSHHAEYCLEQVSKMRFKSKEPSAQNEGREEPLIFFDVEVFPNLFLLNWKREDIDKVHRMINPKPYEVEELMRHRLVGFNCRKYDNHILYAWAFLGYSNEQLFKMSQSIVTDARSKCMIGEAYNVSYTDVYDFAAKKQSLKKWEIDLQRECRKPVTDIPPTWRKTWERLHVDHQELGLPWDEPVPEELWEKVARYCDNDVVATQAVFEYLEGDFTARRILAEIAGLSVNDTTNTLTTRIVFGKERHPQLVYTDLSETFPGYSFERGEDGKMHNMYRGDDLGFGGYIRSWPGIYENVALLDVASLHPNSIRAMNCFGEYTKHFTDILDARVAIKHGDYELAKTMMNGRLAKYLTDKKQAKQLAQALKIAINSVYGLTSASFDNPFRDPRNTNNIVALRGALFMRTLQDEVLSRGFDIVAIKTDSIKIANATPEIIEFALEFAKGYGYSFEHEATYSKICQINDADYVAKYKGGDHDGEWTVTGAQFAVPYVFKKLFSHEAIEFDDLCETKSVKTALYLDMNEELPDDQHDYRFVGKVGQFTPIKQGCGGGQLMRKGDGERYSFATGARGYRWLESEYVRLSGRESDADYGYYNRLVDEAKKNIEQYGDPELFCE